MPTLSIKKIVELLAAFVVIHEVGSRLKCKNQYWDSKAICAEEEVDMHCTYLPGYSFQVHYGQVFIISP